MSDLPTSTTAAVFSVPLPRTIGRVNWRGMWELYMKEVRRFWKVVVQTVAAPVITSLMFLLVMVFAFGRQGVTISGYPFAEFLVPGLIIMTMIQNAFANTSSSILMAKVQGNIVDVLMPPLSAMAERLRRAQNNLFETLPLFIAAVLIAHVAGKESSTTALGAQIYFWGRVAYLPLYAFGVRQVRSLVWLASTAGLLMIFWALLAG